MHELRCADAGKGGSEVNLEQHNRSMEAMAARLNSIPIIEQFCEKWGVESGGEFPTGSGFCVKTIQMPEAIELSYRMHVHALNSEIIKFAEWKEGDEVDLFNSLSAAERDVFDRWPEELGLKIGKFQPQTGLGFEVRWRWVCEVNEITPDNKDKTQGYFRCVWRIAARPILK